MEEEPGRREDARSRRSDWITEVSELSESIKDISSSNM